MSNNVSPNQTDFWHICMNIKGIIRSLNIIITVILLPFLGYSLCLWNWEIYSNKIFRLGKNFQKYWPFLIGKQPVIGCKIDKIKSLNKQVNSLEVCHSSLIEIFYDFSMTLNLPNCIDREKHSDLDLLSVPSCNHHFLQTTIIRL